MIIELQIAETAEQLQTADNILREAVHENPSAFSAETVRQTADAAV